jgi:hypothetical protein
MAEPLTSSDIFRAQRGWGVSPLASEEERKRFASSGISPLTSQARERFETGRGISPMASESEKQAWRVSEIQAGLRSPSELPESYGGMGERPKATTRRGFRMQQEWDKQREMMAAEQEAARRAEMENRELELRNRNLSIQERQEARLQAAEAKSQEEIFKISEQADLALSEVLGGVDPSGAQISGLDPDSPDYMERRNDIIKRYPKAMKDDAFKAAISTTDKSYFDKLNFDQQLQVQEQSESRMLGKEERMEERQRTAREEERKTAEERTIVSQEREIQKSIRQANEKLKELDASMAGKKSLTATQKANLDAARNTLLDLRIEKAALRGLVFESEEDADKANPPSGSTIYIGRKPFKVP